MLNKDELNIDLTRPLLKNGPSFLSHKIIFDGDVAYLKPTITTMLFCVIYIFIGLFLSTIASYLLITSKKYDLAIFLGGFGIAITTFGISLIRPFLHRTSFNKQSDVFNNRRDRDVKLHHIDSLQINNKVIQRKNALSYHCYELNLLTKHGRRINILNHNNQQQLEHDAHLLGLFLNVSVDDYQNEIIL